ncbi:hypothetical protein EDB87DRAFT_1677956 [Lactarius vividus]|nr:hypothetical protein EDB87DRAFT_1677956 [Lactarius vividus]
MRFIRNYLFSISGKHGHALPWQGFHPTPLSTSEPQKRRVSSPRRPPIHTYPACGTRRAHPLSRMGRERSRTLRTTPTMRAATAAQSRVSLLSGLSGEPTDVLFSVSSVQRSKVQEEKGRKGFRHTDNLRLGHLCYMLPIIFPATSDVPILEPGPTSDPKPAALAVVNISEPFIFFDVHSRNAGTAPADRLTLTSLA